MPPRKANQRILIVQQSLGNSMYKPEEKKEGTNNKEKRKERTREIENEPRKLTRT